ncbi:MAG: hypothetical protein ACXW2U_02485 [Telluria sp.]
MNTLANWFAPLETSGTLDALVDQWEPLLAAHHASTSSELEDCHDAILYFLALSALPANLKLGAVFACTSEFDFDLRLAWGVLADQLDQFWTPPTASQPMMDAHLVDMPSNNAWLSGYAHGRLAQVLAAVRVHREENPWRQAFWDAYLLMGRRRDDMAAVRMAQANGAGIDRSDAAPAA